MNIMETHTLALTNANIDTDVTFSIEAPLERLGSCTYLMSTSPKVLDCVGLHHDCYCYYYYDQSSLIVCVAS